MITPALSNHQTFKVMNHKIDLETAQHLCGLVSRFFDQIAESSPEWGEVITPKYGDFRAMCRDFTFDPAELELAEQMDRRVVYAARTIMQSAE